MCFHINFEWVYPVGVWFFFILCLANDTNYVLSFYHYKDFYFSMIYGMNFSIYIHIIGNRVLFYLYLLYKFRYYIIYNLWYKWWSDFFFFFVICNANFQLKGQIFHLINVEFLVTIFWIFCSKDINSLSSNIFKMIIFTKKVFRPYFVGVPL